MALRDKMQANAQPFLDPDETVQAIFAATTVRGLLVLPFILIAVLPGFLIFALFVNKNMIVVATNKRILVCQSGRFTMTPVKEVLQELPRETRIGPAGGLSHKWITPARALYIHKRFHTDVASADAMATTPPA